MGENNNAEAAILAREVTGEPSSFAHRILTYHPPKFTFRVLARILIFICGGTLIFLLFDKDALPGGNVFTLCVVLFGGIAVGDLFSVFRLPPLLGMLCFGILIRNIPSDLEISNSLSTRTSSIFRQLALIIILIRAGIGLDPDALIRLKGVVLRLAFCPCLAEALTVAVASHLILNLPWLWGLILGFVLAAVSPAVVVPSLLSLSERGYGVQKGIPTIVIAASSVDDILAISSFGLVLGLNFSTGESIVWSILQGPLEALLGILYGLVSGCVLGVFFGNAQSTPEKLVPVILTFFVGGIAVFGFQYIEYPGSGALGCLTSAFVAALFWRKKKLLVDGNDTICNAFSVLWYVFQPFLFGLIGCEIDLWNLNPSVAGLGILCLVIGLVIRLIVSYLSITNAGLNFKEKLFIAVAWIPKATVQAAIGSVGLDTARTLKAGPQQEAYGLQVLTIAVLVILITAPVGAMGIGLLGPRFLTQDQIPEKYKKNSDAGQINLQMSEANPDIHEPSLISSH